HLARGKVSDDRALASEALRREEPLHAELLETWEVAANDVGERIRAEADDLEVQRVDRRQRRASPRGVPYREGRARGALRGDCRERSPRVPEEARREEMPVGAGVEDEPRARPAKAGS